MIKKFIKKNLNIIVKFFVSIILFYQIFKTINLNQVVNSFSLLNLYFIPLVFFLIILNYLLSSIRWKYLLIHKNSEQIKISYLVNLYFIGSFFNNFMPTSMGGDVYKVYALGKKISSKSNAFAGTFMERFTGMIALVLISYIGLVQTLSFWEEMFTKYITGSEFLMYLFRFGVFFGFWLGTLFAFFSLKFLSNKILFFKKIYDSFYVYKGQYKVILIALLASLFVQIFSIFSQYFIFSALNVNLQITYALTVFPVITLVGFFVPSLNGLGIQDALYIQFFSIVGVNPEIALTASILYHLLRVFVSLIGGVLYAFGKDK